MPPNMTHIGIHKQEYICMLLASESPLGKNSGDPREQPISPDQSPHFKDHREPTAGPKIIPQEEAPAATADNLSWILGTCMVEGRTDSQKLSCALHTINQPINTQIIKRHLKN